MNDDDEDGKLCKGWSFMTMDDDHKLDDNEQQWTMVDNNGRWWTMVDNGGRWG